MNNKKKCFVIMPISKTKSCTSDEWAGIFEHMIKPAVTGSKLGFDCEQAKPLTGAFIRDILDRLNRADVVIADLTDKNPNVFYELGIRHTLKNRTILIVQNIKHVPSDLRSYWVVTYEKDLTGAEKFKRRVREILREMQKNPDKPDSPVADFLGLKNIDIFAYEKSANLKKLSALITELSYDVNSIASILDSVKISEGRRKKSKREFTVSNERFSNTCLELLLSTSYVTLPQKLSTIAWETNELIKLTNNTLENWVNQTLIEEVEGKLKKVLPRLKNVLTHLLEEIAKVRADYANDNYPEPKEPIILLASPEHEELLKITQQAT